MSVPYPVPPQKNNIRVIVIGVIIVAVLLLALLVLGGISLFRSASGTIHAAEPTAVRFLGLLQHHDGKTAFGLMSADVQATTTAASLSDIQDLLEKRRGRMVGYTGPSGQYVAVNNGVTSVRLNYQENFENGSVPVEITVVRTADGWRVSGYHFQN